MEPRNPPLRHRPPGVVGRPSRWVAAGAVGTLALLTGCAGDPEPAAPTPSAAPVPERSPSGPAATPSEEPEPAPTSAAFPDGPALAAATDQPTDVLTGLAAPWGTAFLPGGAVLVSLRDVAQVLLHTADGVAPLTGPGATELAEGTRTDGEGGLLGLTVSPDVEEDRLVYLYRTTSSGNQVVRAELDADAGTLGPLEEVIGGIPAASNHNGGRVAFGPDGFLYVSTGDASARGAAQDPDSLAGKILRLTPDGEPAPGNPTEGSPVWSLGHRNVQGLGWTDDGRMVASEFGQNTFDELNVIERGANYGWPETEGPGGGDAFVDPVLTWSPSEASPSGIAVAGGNVYVAGLRGRTLWEVPLDDPDAATPHLEGELGRLRDVSVGPDGALWVLTNNTDGRGDPRAGDDRLVRLTPP